MDQEESPVPATYRIPCLRVLELDAASQKTSKLNDQFEQLSLHPFDDKYLAELQPDISGLIEKHLGPYIWTPWQSVQADEEFLKSVGEERSISADINRLFEECNLETEVLDFLKEEHSLSGDTSFDFDLGEFLDVDLFNTDSKPIPLDACAKDVPLENKFILLDEEFVRKNDFKLDDFKEPLHHIFDLETMMSRLSFQSCIDPLEADSVVVLEPWELKLTFPEPTTTDTTTEGAQLFPEARPYQLSHVDVLVGELVCLAVDIAELLEERRQKLTCPSFAADSDHAEGGEVDAKMPTSPSPVSSVKSITSLSMDQYLSWPSHRFDSENSYGSQSYSDLSGGASIDQCAERSTSDVSSDLAFSIESTSSDIIYNLGQTGDSMPGSQLGSQDPPGLISIAESLEVGKLAPLMNSGTDEHSRSQGAIETQSHLNCPSLPDDSQDLTSTLDSSKRTTKKRKFVMSRKPICLNPTD